MSKTESYPPVQFVRLLQRFSAVLLALMAAIAVSLFWRSQPESPTEPLKPTNSAIATASRSADQQEAPTVDRERNSEEAVKPLSSGEQTQAENQTTTWGIVEDFELTERSGRKITNKDLLGRPWAVCFIFIQCAGPCQRITGQMRLLQDRLADEKVRLVTITVDPQRDTPQQLAAYADAFGADGERWWFLTGDQRKIYHLIQASFQMPVQEMVGADSKPGFEILHSTNVLHVDATGRVRGKYDASQDAEMVALGRVLQREADELEQQNRKVSEPLNGDGSVAAPLPAASPTGRTSAAVKER